MNLLHIYIVGTMITFADFLLSMLVLHKRLPHPCTLCLLGLGPPKRVADHPHTLEALPPKYPCRVCRRGTLFGYGFFDWAKAFMLGAAWPIGIPATIVLVTWRVTVDGLSFKDAIDPDR